MSTSRILFLEDEIILALAFTDAIEALELGPVLQVTSVDEAEAELDRGRVDVAVLDVNIDGVSSFGVARRVIALGGQVVFATGYNHDETLFKEFDAEVLRKPYEDEELAAAVLRAHARLCAASS